MSDTTARNLSIASVSIGAVLVALALIFYSRLSARSPGPILATSAISAFACFVCSVIAVTLDTSSNYGWSFIGFVLSFLVFVYSYFLNRRSGRSPYENLNEIARGVEGRTGEEFNKLPKGVQTMFIENMYGRGMTETTNFEEGLEKFKEKEKYDVEGYV